MQKIFKGFIKYKKPVIKIGLIIIAITLISGLYYYLYNSNILHIKQKQSLDTSQLVFKNIITEADSIRRYLSSLDQHILTANNTSITNKINLNLGMFKLLSITANPGNIIDLPILEIKANDSNIVKICDKICINLDVSKIREYLLSNIEEEIKYKLEIKGFITIIDNKTDFNDNLNYLHKIKLSNDSILMYLTKNFKKLNNFHLIFNTFKLMAIQILLMGLLTSLSINIFKKSIYANNYHIRNKNKFLLDQIDYYSNKEMLWSKKNYVENKFTTMILNILKNSNISYVNNSSSKAEHIINFPEFITDCRDYFEYDSFINNINFQVEDLTQDLQFNFSNALFYQVMFSIIYNCLSVIPENSSLNITAKNDNLIFSIELIDNGFGLLQEQFENYSYNSSLKKNIPWLISQKSIFDILSSYGFTYEYMKREKEGNILKFTRELRNSVNPQSGNIYNLMPHLNNIRKPYFIL